MLKTKINTILLCTLFTLFFPLSAGAQYRNPILYADVPDMSVCRAGDYFYMVSLNGKMSVLKRKLLMRCGIYRCE